nr:RNA-directed DNA polymerase, eukaryota, reverse transcriptase zinc-binding domain protein [Tanacetum cinerariifolium]
MKAIHGEDGKIGKDLKACNQSCWLNVVNEITVLKLQGFNFFDFMRFKLGNGINISFWNENWIGGNTLKNLYPRIYALENYKHVTVHMKLADQTLAASLRHKPRGGSGDISVASIRTEIDNKRLKVINSKTKWIKSVPIKVNVHAWKVKLDALPTRLNISR